MLPRDGQLLAATTYARRAATLRRLLGDQAVQAYDELDDYEQADLDAFLDKVVPLSLAAQRAMASTLAGYLYTASGEYPGEPLDLDEVTGDAIRPDNGLRAQWQIPWWAMLGALGAGVAWAVVVAGTRNLVRTQAVTDLSLVQSATVAKLAPQLPTVLGYRRVLSGPGCDFCTAAAAQLYRSADLMDLHPGCNCAVAAVFADADPAAALNSTMEG